MPVDYNALGSRIAHYRGKLNLSQEELAEQVNLSREYINKIETAARKPTLDTLIDIGLPPVFVPTSELVKTVSWHPHSFIGLATS